MSGETPTPEEALPDPDIHKEVDGGFVRKGAVEDIKKAEEMAYMEKEGVGKTV